MGQMKKVYEQQPDPDIEPLVQASITLTRKCHDVLDRIRTAENLIGDYIEEGYITDLYAARSILGDAIKLLEEPVNATGQGSGTAASNAG